MVIPESKFLPGFYPEEDSMKKYIIEITVADGSSDTSYILGEKDTKKIIAALKKSGVTFFDKVESHDQ